MTALSQTGQINYSENFFRRIIEHSTWGIILVDRNLNIAFDNPVAARMVGYDVGDMLGRHLPDLIHPQDSGPFKQAVASVCAKIEEPPKNLWRIRHATGGYITIGCTLTNFCDSEIDGVLLSFADVTRQVEQQVVQKPSEMSFWQDEGLRMFFDSLPASIAYFSSDLTCRFANLHYKQLVGGVEEAVGKSLMDLLSPAAYRAQEKHQRAVLKGIRQSFERLPCGALDQINTPICIQYLPDGKPGNISGFYLLAVNITEVSSCQATTGQESSQLAVLLDAIGDGFMTADAEYRYKYVNSKLCQMVGLSREEMIGRRIWDIFPDAFGSQTHKSMQEALLENRYVCSEDYYAPLDLWQENRIYPNSNGFSMFIQDINRRKSADEQLYLLFDRTPDMIGILGLDRYFKRINPAMCKLLSYTEEELLSIKLDQLIHPDDLEISRKRTRAFIEGGDQTLYFENRYVTKIGKTIWLSWTVTRTAGEGLLFCIGKDITEKKETEQLLYKANQLARIGSWEVDLVNKTAYWSKITREIYEVPDTFIPGADNWLSFYREGADRNYIAGKMAGTISTGIPCDAEVQLITAQGNTRWVRAIAEAEFRNGKCVRTFGSFQDIDERKKAELAAIAALAERNSILESIGDGFFAVNKDWIFSYWNATAEKKLGKQTENVLGKRFADIFGKDASPEFFDQCEHAMNSGTVLHFHFFYEIQQIWFAVSVYPSENGLSVFLRDITESKLAVQALAESEKRYSDLFQLNPLPMFVYDMETLRYLDVNKSAVASYGYSYEEFLAMTIFDIRPPKDIPLIQNAVLEHRHHEHVKLPGIFRHCKKNGEVINVDIQSSIIMYRGKKAKVVLANDVTEREQYINAIEEQNKKLREISWMQSHVIRAPLARIIGLLPMFASSVELDDEQQTIYDYLIASAAELDQVIHSITDVSVAVDLK